MSVPVDPEDRIFILEDALVKAYNLASFLYGCLTDPIYEHAYPDMSLRTLTELAPLVRQQTICFHSFTKEGCEGCAERNAIFKRRDEIKAKYADEVTEIHCIGHDQFEHEPHYYTWSGHPSHCPGYKKGDTDDGDRPDAG